MTPDDMCETNQSPLGRTLNVVSSDAFIDRATSPVMKSRRGSNNTRNDGYKKMNKVPYKEMAQKIINY